MGCLADVLASDFSVRFNCKRKAQKYLIEFLLTYSRYDLKNMAEMLDVSPDLLGQVLLNKSYLSDSTSQELFKYFWLFIND